MPAEGAPVGLALRRLRNRAHVVNLLVARLRQKVLQRPLDVDTVQHALPHEVDQVRQQVSELRKQVFELEEHLGNRPLLPALDKVALGRESPTATEDQGPQPPQALSVPRLQRKLKEAARKILRLRLEKEQLLEMGNRLRAELGHRAPGHQPKRKADCLFVRHTSRPSSAKSTKDLVSLEGGAVCSTLLSHTCQSVGDRGSFGTCGSGSSPFSRTAFCPPVLKPATPSTADLGLLAVLHHHQGALSDGPQGPRAFL